MVALLPVVVAMVLVVAQVGIVARQRIVLVHAAAQAARAASVDPSTGAARAAATTGGVIDATRLDLEVVDGGDLVTVTLHYEIATNVPIIGVFVDDVNVTETVTAAKEGLGGGG